MRTVKKQLVDIDAAIADAEMTARQAADQLAAASRDYDQMVKNNYPSLARMTAKARILGIQGNYVAAVEFAHDLRVERERLVARLVMEAVAATAPPQAKTQPRAAEVVRRRPASAGPSNNELQAARNAARREAEAASRRVWHNIAAAIDRGVQRVTTEVNSVLRTALKDNADAVSRRVDDAWRVLAQKTLNNRPKHLGAYLEGIQPTTVRDGKLTLRLSGDDAAKVEVGWAPPPNNGASPNEGLGLYDGKPHDMRPFLLYGRHGWNGKPGKGPTDTDPKPGEEQITYKIVKLPFEGANEGDFIGATRAFLQAHQDKKRLPRNKKPMSGREVTRLTRQFKAGLREAHVDADNRPDEPYINDEGELVSDKATLGSGATHGIPKSRTILWSKIMQDEGKPPMQLRHRNYLYKKLRVKAEGGKRYSYSTLRYISNDKKQADLWYAIGVPPAHIMQDEHGKDGPLMKEVARVIAEVAVERAIRRLDGKRYKETVKQ